MTGLEVFFCGALIGVICCVMYGDIRRRLRMAPPNKSDALTVELKADTKEFEKSISKAIALTERLVKLQEKLK